MTAETWIRAAVGEDRLRMMAANANRRRLEKAIESTAHPPKNDEELRFAINALEL